MCASVLSEGEYTESVAVATELYFHLLASVIVGVFAERSFDHGPDHTFVFFDIVFERRSRVIHDRCA